MSLGFIYLYKGEYQEAIEKLNNSLQIEENNNVLGYLGYTYAVSGQRGEAEKILEQLKKRSKQKYISPYYSAIINAGLGKKEKAFEDLEKLFDEHSDWLVWLKLAPELKSLRSDERFTNLLKRVKLL
jgi:tetratricopeptide (TPR) repeat protein